MLTEQAEILQGFTKSSIKLMLKISVFYLDKQSFNEKSVLIETVLIGESLYIWNWFQRTKATGTYCLTGKSFHCFGCKTHHSNLK
mgnify:CR=1 FL=1